MKKNNIKNEYGIDDLIFLPLGGSGEIGMNCNLYHFKNKWLIVDLGITFKDEKIENADLVLPDIEYILERKEKLCGMVLTHAHEDHIGALPYLYSNLKNIPIYTTSFTASVLKRKFKNSINITEQIKLLQYNKMEKIGPFGIEIFRLTHSIPEPSSILIRTEKGNIFHTGDWKIDPKPLIDEAINENKMKSISKVGIDLMVCDSTNVFDEKSSGSENDVRENLQKIFTKKRNGKIIITCFASNIARLETIGFVAEMNNRSCVLLGRSLKTIYESALENNYLKNLPRFLNEKEAQNIPEENLVLICTGSQGESRAALSKLVFDRNNYFQINRKDLLIFSSREIPGNESQINILKNQLVRIGCDFLDHTNSMVHVSGHPSKVELKKMYDWINPKSLIPVHGEFRHLIEHVNFSRNSGINTSLLAENGDLIKIEKNFGLTSVGKVHSGRKYLKGTRILSREKKIFNNLRVINSDGELSLIIIIDLDNNLLSNPLILSKTFLDEDDEKGKIKIKKYLIGELEKMLESHVNDILLEEEIKKIIRTFIKKEYGIKPLTDVKIIRIK